MRTLYALVVVALTGCSEVLGPNAEQRLETRVQQELAKAPRTTDAFLTFAYGDDQKTLQRKAAKLVAEGKATAANSDISLVNYRFTDPYDLADVTWGVHPLYHNDTLVSLSLYASQGVERDIDQLHQLHHSLLEKYQAVYGQPVVLSDGDNVFVKGEKKVTVRQDEKYYSLHVRYENTRLMKYRLGAYGLSKIDDHGNSYDSLHWAAHEKAHPPVDLNPDRI